MSMVASISSWRTTPRSPVRCCSATATGPSARTARPDTPPSPQSVAIRGPGPRRNARPRGGESPVRIGLRAEGDGHGAFGSRIDVDAGNYPWSVAIADLNGDGHPDLAVANRGPGVSVLLGEGDGTFGPKTDFAATYNAYCVAIGDLNHDARPDLAISGGLGVTVLLGNGDGTFGSPVRLRHGRGLSAHGGDR